MQEIKREHSYLAIDVKTIHYLHERLSFLLIVLKAIKIKISNKYIKSLESYIKRKLCIL